MIKKEMYQRSILILQGQVYELEIREGFYKND